MKDINKIAIIGDNSERIQIIDIKTKKQFYKLFGKPNEDDKGNIVEYWMGLEYPEKYKFVIDGYEESDEHLRKRILKRMRKFNAIK